MANRFAVLFGFSLLMAQNYYQTNLLKKEMTRGQQEVQETLQDLRNQNQKFDATVSTLNLDNLSFKRFIFDKMNNFEKES